MNVGLNIWVLPNQANASSHTDIMSLFLRKPLLPTSPKHLYNSVRSLRSTRTTSSFLKCCREGQVLCRGSRWEMFASQRLSVHTNPVQPSEQSTGVPFPTNCQVVIAGGGVIGASVAYHLAEVGWTDVVLLEQGR